MALSLTFEGYFSSKPPQNQYVRKIQYISHRKMVLTTIKS